jgi:hypothetical protein
LTSIGTGLTPDQWRGELDRLVADMSRGEPADIALRHRLLLERMYTLMPNGMAHDGACRKCPEVLIETAQLGPG